MVRANAEEWLKWFVNTAFSPKQRNTGCFFVTRRILKCVNVLKSIIKNKNFNMSFKFLSDPFDAAINNKPITLCCIFVKVSKVSKVHCIAHITFQKLFSSLKRSCASVGFSSLVTSYNPVFHCCWMLVNVFSDLTYASLLSRHHKDPFSKRKKKRKINL